MNRNRNYFMRNALLAGGIALGGAGLYWGMSGREGVAMPGTPGITPAPMRPVQNVVSDYRGADNPAALQMLMAQESQAGFTLVMYHAGWCPYCQKLTQQVSEASAHTDVQYKVIRVDVERFPELARAAKQSEGVPETFVFLNGRQVDHFVGAAADTPMVVNYLKALAEQHGPADVTKPAIAAPAPFPRMQ